MGKKLAYTVHVTETKPVDPKKPDGDTYIGRQEVFERGSELPDWAASFVGDHVYAEEDVVPGPIAPNGKADHMLPPEEPGAEARAPEAKATAAPAAKK